MRREFLGRDAFRSLGGEQTECEGVLVEQTGTFDRIASEAVEQGALDLDFYVGREHQTKYARASEDQDGAGDALRGEQPLDQDV